jgi:hypothetical protein
VPTLLDGGPEQGAGPASDVQPSVEPPERLHLANPPSRGVSRRRRSFPGSFRAVGILGIQGGDRLLARKRPGRGHEAAGMASKYRNRRTAYIGLGHRPSGWPHDRMTAGAPFFRDRFSRHSRIA